ncbi:MAG: sodium:alanine symporter family protein [Firmicutes bacterium]|nr:sodium:alanine symporter family protein [Bacillota bacterium]
MGALMYWFGGWPAAVLLVAAGLFLTLRSGFIPLRRFCSIFRLTLGRLGRKDGPAGKGAISPFQALTTALAATVGTGNIAGVATAITLGGPGAIFWMWVSAFFGMTTKFAEIVLAVRFRVASPGGSFAGGPMYALRDGLRRPGLGLAYAFFGAAAAFGIGNLVQANSVAGVLQTAFGITPLFTGIVLAVLVALVILGGIRRIGGITEKLVPVMALLYVGGSLAVLFICRCQIVPALGEIIRSAFSGRAAAGGFAGAGVLQAVHYGVIRGVFSNEAGLGSASIAHAAAVTDHPVRQGLWGIVEVFIVSYVICTMTALVLLVTGAWTGSLEGASLTAAAFNEVLPVSGHFIVSASLILFAFSTLLSWSYYGEQCFQYIFDRGRYLYRLLWIIGIVVGALGGLRPVWAFADSLNALMILFNLGGLVGMSALLVGLDREFWAGQRISRR